MKKTRALLLIFLLLCMPAQVFGKSFEELKVGNTTPMNGDFFSDMWGNATSDLDVRKLLHSYNLVSWNFSEGLFQINPIVVSGFVVTQNPSGDHIYQISLYDDLCYSDGSSITAWDYAFSILLQLTPAMEELGARTGRIRYIQGADAFLEGTADELSGVHVINDLEFTVTVDSSFLPYFYELGLLNFQPWPIQEIAPGITVADDGSGVYYADADTGKRENALSADMLKETLMDPETGYRSHPKVTSGPYMLTDFDGETAAFEINPFFKGDADGGLPSIKKLTYTLSENSTMIGKLKEGTFDLLNKVSAAETIKEGLALTVSGEEFSMSGYPRNGMSFAAAASSSVPAQDAAVRRALAWCMDRKGIASGYEGNYGLPVEGYFGIGQWMYGLMNGSVPYPVDEEDEEKALEERSAWEALNLEGCSSYTMEDPDAEKEEAARILDEAGWNLNENGEPFDPSSDALRWKEMDGEMVPLRLILAYPKGNTVGTLLEEYLAVPAAKAGMEISVQEMEFPVILKDFYGQESSGADFLYLATNFDEIFDPAENFREDKDGNHIWGGSGIADEALYELAVDMRKTTPGDVLSYCRKWVAFQERFTQVLPLIPIYSNMYFDFYTSSLQNYEPMKQVSWAQEILYSFYGDAPAAEEAMQEAEDDFEWTGEEKEAVPGSEDETE